MDQHHVSACLGFVPIVFIAVMPTPAPSLFTVQVQMPTPEVFVVFQLPTHGPFVITWTYAPQNVVSYFGKHFVGIPATCPWWLVPGVLTPGIFQMIERLSPIASMREHMYELLCPPNNHESVLESYADDVPDAMESAYALVLQSHSDDDEEEDPIPLPPGSPRKRTRDSS